MSESDLAQKYVDPRAHALRARYVDAFGGAEIPVPVESIAEDLLGLRIEEHWDLGDCSGLLVPTERLIVLNAAERSSARKEPARRFRFTVAHELGHWICHAQEGGHSEPVYCRQADLAGDANRALEREANIFAAELLMPEDAVRKAWKSTWDIDRCASLLEVSREATHWRLFGFGLVAESPRKSSLNRTDTA